MVHAERAGVARSQVDGCSLIVSSTATRYSAFRQLSQSVQEKQAFVISNLYRANPMGGVPSHHFSKQQQLLSGNSLCKFMGYLEKVL